MKLNEALDKVFFTADMHLGHRNIIDYCNRPFTRLKDHDRTIIENFNRVMDEDSIIYHVGDFTLGDSRQAENTDYLVLGVSSKAHTISGCSTLVGAKPYTKLTH